MATTEKESSEFINMWLKHSKFSTQSLSLFTIFSLIIILLFNWYIIQNDRQLYKASQDSQAKTLLEALAVKIELPLIIADTESINQILTNFSGIDSIYSIDILDNNDDIVANRQFLNTSLTAQQEISPYLYNKTITNTSANSEFEDIFGEEAVTIEPQKIGYIKILMQPYDIANTYKNNKQNLIANLILVVILILLGLTVYSRAKRKEASLNFITSMLDKSILQHKQPMESQELEELHTASIKVINNLLKQNSQLANLQQEIRYAREDSQTELNQFILFLQKHKQIHLGESLSIFANAITTEQSKEKQLIDIRKVVTMILAKYSNLAQENKVIITDNHLAKILEHKVHIDKALFEQFLTLLIKQLILLCKKSEIKIHTDINEVYGKHQILRLSFESNSPDFRRSLELQSLFDFNDSGEISITSNNTNLIASKHLLQKAGGDYFFLSNEIRFEFPVRVEKNTVTAININLINQLDIPHNILVYDSDPIERMVLMGYLQKLGQEVDKATTKQVVLQKVRQNQFDILCVNSEFFSEQDPYFLTNFKAEYESAKNKPVIIVITSHQHIVHNENFKAFNAQYLSKPIEPNQLAEILSEHF